MRNGNLRAYLIRQLFESFRGVYTLTVAASIAAAIILWPYLPAWLILSWVTAVAAAECFKAAIGYAYLYFDSPNNIKRWNRLFGTATRLGSAAWSFCALFLIWPLPDMMALILGMASLCLAAVTLNPLIGFHRIYRDCTLILIIPISTALMLMPPAFGKDAWAGLVILTSGLYLIVLSVRLQRRRLRALKAFFNYRGLSRQLHFERDRRREIQERLAQATTIDMLTGLPNQKRFLEQAQELLNRELETIPSRDIVILLIDLEGFTQINSSIGRAGGDYLLLQTGLRLKYVISEGAIGRIGNDEFAIATPLPPGATHAGRLINHLRSALEAPVRWDERNVETAVSIGYSLAPKHGTDIETVLRKADIALHQARISSSNQPLEFKLEMETHIANRFALQRALRHAMENNELSLAYQPLIHLNTGQVVGAETLLRWHSKEFGPVSPVQFIPLAEQTGLINEIGRWVLREACRQAALWMSSRKDFAISVNVSLEQLADTSFSDTVRDALRMSGLPPKALLIEITESVLMTDPASIIRLLREIRQLGVRIALDDFGTGYSALSYLIQLDIDYLKLDKTFISNLTRSDRAATIVRSTMALAKALRLQVIAEGIETPDDWHRLNDEHCMFGQGFHFSRPVPAAQFEALPERYPLPRRREQAY
ncbi:bifunctional diguanylate cyclase/phosphodiesterase [Alkalilimnicola ehrlichii]|nr:bifunctional diguanylate cyclase/phosphodiesterase [Alkalilimnicola ehrlichii]